MIRATPVRPLSYIGPTMTHSPVQGILRTMLISCVLQHLCFICVVRIWIRSYPAAISTLGSRLVLNLRGSLLRQAGVGEQTTVKLDTLVFAGEMELQQHQAFDVTGVYQAWR